MSSVRRASTPGAGDEGEVDPYAPPRAPLAEVDGRAPWDPKAIGFISFFFSFLPAGIMLGLNYERLGQPEKKVPVIVATLISAAVFGALVWNLPEDTPNGVFQAVSLGIALWFASVQKSTFTAHVARGGVKASPWPAAGLSALVVTAVVGVAVLAAYREAEEAEAHFEQAMDAAAEGRTEEAIETYEAHLESNPEESSAHFNLAQLLLQEGRLDEALHHAQEFRQMEPDDADGEALVDAIRDAQRADPAE